MTATINAEVATDDRGNCHADDDHFGLCPICPTDSIVFRHVGPEHWAACDIHKVTWCVGNNLFSAWREMTEEDFRAAKEELATYRVVAETHCECPRCRQEREKVETAPASTKRDPF